MKKRSFFERLSASSSNEDYDGFEDDFPIQHPGMPTQTAPARSIPVTGMQTQGPQLTSVLAEEEVAEGQLPVDVYQTANDIIIRTRGSSDRT